MCTKHFDQAFILRTVLANRLELVATGPERGARAVLEGGDRRIGLDARVDQVFGQGADNAMRSGRIEARTGLRMMPTSPRSPLRFRTASFPQYGSKAGLSDGAFPDRASVKLAPSIPVVSIQFASILRALRSSMDPPF